MKGLYLRRKVWWLNFTRDGRRIFLSTGEVDESRAILRARQILEDPDSWLGGTSEVRVLLDRYHQEKALRGISDRWREDESYALRSFFDGHGISRPRDITAPKVTAWIADKRQRTAEQYLAIITRFCRWLVATGKITVNPCDSIPRAKQRPRPRRRFLTLAESRRLIAACECPDLKAAIMLALHAGLRKGECLAARWTWVDLSAGLLHVQTDADWTPKDRSDRTIPLSDELRDFLAEKRHGLPPPIRDTSFIVRPQKVSGSWRNRWEFRKPFDSVLQKADIEGVTFHDLRRTFASLLVSRGVSIYKVARWLGDGVAVVERHYGHLIAQDDEINRAWT